MPSLNTGRSGHGCTTYSTGGEQVLLVTGGYDDGLPYLDSTEVLRGSGWQEITSARLPRPLDGVKVITVSNRVLLFGGYIGGPEHNDDVLEYNKDGDTWSNFGSITK